MSDEKPSRSRTAWPGPVSVADVELAAVHQLLAPLAKRNRLLTRAVVVLSVCVVALGVLFLLIISQRGEQRDRETAEINQRIDDAVRQGRCELLDQLPPSPLLDRLRGAFGCGPGIPIEDLPPEIQDQLANRQHPAARSLQQVRPEQLPPREGPGPTDFPLPAEPEPTEPEPDPVVDLEPITDPLCEATGVCG